MTRRSAEARGTPLLALPLVPAVVALVAPNPLSVRGSAVAVAACTAAVGLALEPDPELGERPLWVRAIGSKALLAVCAALLVALDARAHAALCAAAGLGAGVLGLLLAGVFRGLLILGGGAPRARTAVWVFAALSAAAPVWLGPLVERLGAPLALTNAVVAASPLTYLSVLCGYDYLRAPWFYAHTPIGSLRFEPPGALISTVYLLTAGWLLLLVHVRTQSAGGEGNA